MANKGQKTKFFSFVLSPISTQQKGVQTTHCAVELVKKYKSNTPQGRMVARWAHEDKTVIMLEGGALGELKNILAVVEKNRFPYAFFRESEDFLGGLLTAVGVILPEIVYTAIEKKDDYGDSWYEATCLDEPSHLSPNAWWLSSGTKASNRHRIFSNSTPVFELLRIKNSSKLAS